MTYRIGTDANSCQDYIECLICCNRSYNPNDIAQLYCGACHRFHGEGVEPYQSAATEETFRRKVTSRVALADGCEEITLECGHMSIAVGGVFGEVIWCAQCVNDYLETHRAKKNLTW